jgi:N6-adenosine-specific RNA methylase IME4
VKKNKHGKLQTNPGYYLRHAKETCLVFLKGKVYARRTLQRINDVIESVRERNS